MKQLKLSKKSIILSIISLCLIIGVVGIATTTIIDKKNNPYGVKVRKISTDTKGFQIKRGSYEIIDSKSKLNKLLKLIFEPKNDASDYDDLFNSNFYDKYDDDFFESNVLYYAVGYYEYSGYIWSKPYIDIKNCYYSTEKNSILIKANITSKIEHIINSCMALSCEPQYSPRGYVIEFPREIFDDNNLDYTDFMIFYLNYKDEKYFYKGSSSRGKNVQIGLNKYARAYDMHKDEPDLDYDSIIERG